MQFYWCFAKTCVLVFNAIAIIFAFLADYLGYEFAWWCRFGAILIVLVCYCLGGLNLWVL